MSTFWWVCTSRVSPFLPHELPHKRRAQAYRRQDFILDF